MDRLAVTDELRSACGVFSDGEIEALLAMCESDRLRGFDKQEEFDIMADSCLRDVPD
ncbi:unnamed protein product, partial [marine sediment metagenome]